MSEQPNQKRHAPLNEEPEFIDLVSSDDEGAPVSKDRSAEKPAKTTQIRYMSKPPKKRRCPPSRLFEPEYIDLTFSDDEPEDEALNQVKDPKPDACAEPREQKVKNEVDETGYEPEDEEMDEVEDLELEPKVVAEMPVVPEAAVAAEPGPEVSADDNDEASEPESDDEDNSRFEAGEDTCWIDSSDGEGTDNDETDHYETDDEEADIDGIDDEKAGKPKEEPSCNHEYHVPNGIHGEKAQVGKEFVTEEAVNESKMFILNQIDTVSVEAPVRVGNELEKAEEDDNLRYLNQAELEELICQLEAKNRYVCAKVGCLRKRVKESEEPFDKEMLIAQLEGSRQAELQQRTETHKLRKKLKAARREAAAGQSVTAELDDSHQLTEDLRIELAAANDAISEARRQAAEMIAKANVKAAAIEAATTVQAEQLCDVAQLEADETQRKNKASARSLVGKNELARLQENIARTQDLRSNRKRNYLQ